MRQDSRLKLTPKQPLKKNPKYKLRKLSIGVVSFLAGFAVFYGCSISASANEISPQGVGVVIEQSVNENKGIATKEQNEESASIGGDTTNKTDKFSKEQKEEKEKRVKSNENSKAETSNDVEANGLAEKSVNSKDAVSDANSTINTVDNKEASKSSKTETKSTTDKSKWPSMIADRSDEGRALPSGTTFRAEDGDGGGDVNQNILQINIENTLQAMGGRLVVPNPFLLSEKEKEDLISKIKEANPDFFAGDNAEARDIYITNDGQIKFKNTEASEVTEGDNIYSLSNVQGDQIIALNPELKGKSTLSNIPISKFLSYVATNLAINGDELTEDPLKPGKKLFIDISRYGSTKEEALENFYNQNNFDSLPDDIKWAWYNTMVKELGKNGIKVRYQNYSELNPNGIDMWNVDGRIVPAANGATNFIDMSKANTPGAIGSANLGYYNSQGEKPTEIGNPGRTDNINDSLGLGKSIRLDWDGLANVIENVTESEAYKKPPTANKAYYLASDNEEAKKQAITNAVTTEAENTTKTVLGVVPNAEGAGQHAEVLVQYEDGSYKKIEVPVTVQNEWDKDKYTPNTTEVSYAEGTDKAQRDTQILGAVNGTTPEGGVFTKEIVGDTPTNVGNDQIAVVKVTYNDGSTENVDVRVNVTPTNKEAQLQPLGGWTDTNFAELPSNLGDKPASNQGSGKVIEYSAEEWNKSDNYNIFGWKPIDGGKVGIGKNGVNSVNIPPGNNLQWQNGYTGSNRTSDNINQNSLILSNYADQDNYKGVFREVDVTNEREIGWKSITTGLSYPNSMNDNIKVRFIDVSKGTPNEIKSLIVNTNYVGQNDGVVQLPKGTTKVRVELVPTYNQINNWNSISQYNIDKNLYRFSSLVNAFELFRGSKMEDALLKSEKTQIFRNGEKGTYKFTVKNEGNGISGVNGRLPVAPYYGNGDAVSDSKLNAGVDLTFDEKIETESLPVNKDIDPNDKVVINLKPTLYSNGYNTSGDGVSAGETKELLLKTIDLTKKVFNRPTEIVVTDYKLNYGTKNPSLYYNLAQNTYINREGTANDTPYRQDVVANSEESAAKYGNQVTDKTVSNNATGRNIIILMNKTKLRDVITAENAKQLNRDDYTVESWTKYQAALARANDIINENETLENLSVDTATKLAAMASQSDIDNLAAELPKLLVKAPTVVAEDNGNVTITPAKGSIKLETTYNDGTNDITVESIKEEKSSTVEGETPTYSWKINNVITGATQSENIPAGVSIDANTGKITILEKNIKDLSTVTAKDYSAENLVSKDASAVAKDITVPSAPTVTATDKSTVTIAPPSDNDVKSIIVNYTDSNDNNKTVIATKDKNGEWTIEGENSGVTVNIANGTITIPDGFIKADTEVTAKAKDISDNESIENRIRITYAQKYNPTVSGGSVSVNKDNVKTPEEKETLKTDILNKVTVPREAGNVTKEIQGDLPTTVGSHQVPVKVTYADGTEDRVNVTVDITETQAQKDTAITASPVSYKSNVSASDRENAIKNAVTTTTPGVTIKSKEITGDIPTDYTDGQPVNVAVTVTYKDGSTKVVEVPVTVTQTDAQKYNPTVSGGSVSVNKDNVKTPEEKETLKTDILNKVTVPREAGNVTKEIQGDLPTTVGSHQVPVKVTYADGTEDRVNVTVDITETQAQKDTAITASPVSYKSNVSASDRENAIKNAVTTTTPGVTIKSKEITGDIPTDYTDGQPVNVAVTVTYKDGSTKVVEVPVTVTQTDAQKYNPTVSGGSVSVNKDNVKTSEEKETLKTDILNKVTVPREAGNVTKEIQGDLPTTVGSHQVPVKVTYADGTEDRVNVTVDITETQAQKDTAITASPVSYKSNVSASDRENAIKNAVTTTTPGVTIKSKEITGDIPTDYTDGQPVNVAVTVTYKDGSTKVVEVPVTVTQTDAQKYNPTVSGGSVSVNKDNVKTSEEKETLKTDILNKVTVPREAGNVTKEIQGDLPTTVGSHQVPVKVTYADGTEDRVNVTVDITETQAQKDTAITASPVSYKSNVSASDRENAIKNAVTTTTPGVTIKSKEITGDIPTDYTDGQPVNVAVTVTYKDGSTKVVEVPVTVTQTDAQKYNPTVSGGSVSVNKDNVKTSEEKETLKTDILNKVTVPREAGNVTKEIQGDLPTTVGSHQVPVKVTYADGTEDRVNVTVDITETQAQKDTAITASPVSYKSNVSASDRENAIKNAVTTTTPGVTIKSKEITGDIPTDYTDGQPVNVAVTVTYKDGSTKVVEVPVTVTQTDAQKYNPTVSGGSVSVNKDNVKTSEEKETLKTDILNKVTVPREAGNVTKEIQGDLPTTVGSHQVPVKVTYADGTEDRVNVTVDITETQAQKDTAITASPVSYKSNVSASDRENAIKNAVTTTTPGVTIKSKEITGDIPTDYTDGQPVNVAVTVTYKDGSTKVVEVPVTVTQTDAQKYNPTVSGGSVSVNKDNVKTSEEKETLKTDILNKVTVPREAGNVTKEIQGDLPTTVGSHQVPVKVTYADGTEDRVNVTVDITETQAQKDTAITASPVSYKSNVSASDRENAIKNAVTTTTPGVTIKSKEITGDIPTDYTDGQPVNVAVTVTYKDGSTKVVEVPVTVTQTDAQKYNPTVSGGSVSVNKDNVKTSEEKETLKTDILNKVTVPREAGNVTKEIQGDLPTTVGSHQVPVKVTYADGTEDRVNVTVDITETQAQKDTAITASPVSYKSNVSASDRENAIKNAVTTTTPGVTIKSKEITGDIPTDYTDGQPVNVAVTVTYKDGSTKVVEVPVTVTQTDAQKYNPTVSGGSVSVNKDNVKTSEEKETLKTDILNKVTVPREAGNVTKEIQGDLPTTVGSHQVPVKVTYADGTEDRVNVTVDITETQAQKDTAITASPVSYKSNVSASDRENAIKNAVTTTTPGVTIKSKEITGDIPTDYTDGQPVNVAVTVTYKDGSTKVVEVPVTVTQTDAQKYNPTVSGGSVSVNKDNVKTSEEKETLKTDILNKVTVPREAGNVTKEIQGDLPTTVGSHQVPVKVTYADGTEDRVNVTVDITETQAQKDTAITASPVSYKSNVSASDRENAIKNAVTTTTPGVTIKSKEITGDIPTDYTDGQPVNVAVTVTYKDGSTKVVEVPVTVTQTDAQKYNPTVSGGSVSVNKDNVKTSEEKETLKTDILNKVTVPREAGNVTKEIQGDLPTTVGSHQVPVKVTYADGTEDRVNVTVDITETQAQKDTAITASPVSYKSNVSASDRENAIKNAVTTTTPGVTIKSKEITGDIPTDYTDGQPVNVAVTVTYKDGSTKVVEVPVTVTQTDAQKYNPTVSGGSVSVNKDNVKTPEEKETLKTDILNKVTVPREAGNVTKEIQGDLPTTVGSHQVPVKVTYADGTEDRVNVTVDITETQAQKDTAITASPVSYKSNVSASDRENAIKNAVTTTTPGVTIKSKEITGDIPTDYTDGQPVNVAVTVTYKDGSTKVVEVPVTVTQTDAQKYNPTVSGGSVSVNKDNVKTPEEKETLKTDILNKVTVPREAGNVTKEIQGDLPTTVGSHQVPVKVTYADGTEDRVNVTVDITGTQADTKTQAQKDTAITASPVSYKSNVSASDRENAIKNAVTTTTPGVTIKSKEITGDIPTDYTDGQPVNVAVTVTYKDGSTKVVEVPVTVTQTDAQKYNPTVSGGSVSVNKDNVKTSEEKETLKTDILNKVTVPREAGNVTKEIQGDLPTTVGSHQVPVKVTYADGTEDRVNVTVDITGTQADTKTQAQKDTAITESPVSYKSNVSASDRENAIKNAVTTTTPGVTIKSKEITGDIPTDYTDGQPVNVAVTVTYKDGSTKVVEVPVTVTQTDAQKYNPTVSGGSVSVNKDNVKTSEEKETLKTDILNKVTVPREAGNVTKEIQGDLPTTVGSHQVPVKVTYADGTEDRVNVTVDITETQAQKDTAITASPVSYKSNVSASDRENAIKNAVTTTTPGVTIKSKEITGDIPTDYTDGQPVNVAVTVTYKDGSTKVVEVPVTVTQTDAQKYNPTVSGGSVSVNKDNVKTSEEKETLKTDILNKVTVPREAGNVTKEIQGDLPTTVGSHQVPVKVTYADGTEDRVNVTVDITGTQAKLENSGTMTEEQGNPGEGSTTTSVIGKKDSHVTVNKANQLPNTGYVTNVGMYGGLSALSAAGLLLGLKRRRKEEESNEE